MGHDHPAIASTIISGGTSARSHHDRRRDHQNRFFANALPEPDLK
jgi:hypothetical protein